MIWDIIDTGLHFFVRNSLCNIIQRKCIAIFESDKRVLLFVNRCWETNLRKLLTSLLLTYWYRSTPLSIILTGYGTRSNQSKTSSAGVRNLATTVVSSKCWALETIQNRSRAVTGARNWRWQCSLLAQWFQERQTSYSVSRWVNVQFQEELKSNWLTKRPPWNTWIAISN